MEPAALRARVPALLLGVLRVRRFLPYPTHHSRVRFPFFCWASDVAAVPTECHVLVARSRRATSRALLRAAATAGPPPSKATRTRTTRDAGSKSRRERQATVARSVSRKSLGASSAATRNKYHLRRALPRRRREARRLSIWSVPAPSLVGLHQKGQWNKKKFNGTKKLFRGGWQGGTITFRYQPRRSKQGGVDLDSPRFKAVSPTGTILEGANPSQILLQYYNDCRLADEYTRLQGMTSMCESVNEVFQHPSNSKKPLHQATVRCGCPRTHTTHP